MVSGLDTLNERGFAAAAKKGGDQDARRNKKAEVIAMMKRAKGVTLAQIREATGWQAHTVRGFVSLGIHDLRFHLIPDPGVLQCVDRGVAVGRQLRLGDGDHTNFGGGQIFDAADHRVNRLSALTKTFGFGPFRRLQR
jgi:Protein of unknown function (DUF3489)